MHNLQNLLQEYLVSGSLKKSLGGTSECYRLHQTEKLLRERLSKKVAQYDQQGNLIKIYPSVRQAQAEGFDSKSISWVCKGRWKHHKGYVWRFVENS